MLNYRLRQIICLLWNGNYIFIFFLYNFLYKYCVIYKLCNYKSHIELSFSLILLFIERPATFDGIFLLYFSIIILKTSQEEKRARKQGKGKKASGIYRGVLSGKKSCPEQRRAETVDKRSVKEQHVQERRPKEEGQKRMRRKKERRKMVYGGGRVCHGQCSQNVG